MSESTKSSLSFQLLDDIQSLASGDLHSELTQVKIDRLGPAVELFFLNKPSIEEILARITPTIASNTLRDFKSGMAFGVSSDFRECEVAQIPLTVNAIDSPFWTSFLLRAQLAAEASGIVKKMAQALIGTLEEMAENVIWHSQAASTGIGAYKWQPGLFEYCIGDNGIGVLKSLRLNPIYVDVEEPLDALHLALKNGVSRFRSDDHRGTGFNALLRNVVKNGCDIRFHSNDAVVQYEGVSSLEKGSAIKMKDFTAATLSGFTISLVCASAMP